MSCLGWTSTYRVEQTWVGPGDTHWSFLAQVERNLWISPLSGDSQSSLAPLFEPFGAAEEKDRVFTGDLLPVHLNSLQKTHLYTTGYMKATEIYKVTEACCRWFMTRCKGHSEQFTSRSLATINSGIVNIQESHFLIPEA